MGSSSSSSSKVVGTWKVEGSIKIRLYNLPSGLKCHVEGWGGIRTQDVCVGRIK